MRDRPLRPGRDRTIGVRLLLVSGSLRATSTNTAVLRTLAEVAPEGVSCLIYDQLEDLRAFNPDADRLRLPPVVKRLQDVIHRADAIVFASPEYAGAPPGSLKNLLDWSIGDEHADSLYEKPVGWINASPLAATGAYTELRTVLGYAHARVIDAACIQLSVTTGMIGPDGRVSGEALRSALSRVAEILTSIVRQSAETTFEIGMP